MKSYALLLLVFFHSLSSNQILAQDLETYFMKYYKEGNIEKVKQTLSLGFNPNEAKIKNQSILRYVIKNSENEQATVSVLEILVDLGMQLNDYALFQQVVQNRQKLIIDFLVSETVNVYSIIVPDQESFSTEYLLYLDSKGFNIDDFIIKNRMFEIEKSKFITSLRTIDKNAIKTGFDKLGDYQMGHEELYLVIKSKDQAFVEAVLDRSPGNILNTPYTSNWDKSIYGEKPQDIKKMDYPLEWAIRENNFDIVKFLVRKGAKPYRIIESNENVVFEIKNYLNSMYLNYWHEDLNTTYQDTKSKYSKSVYFSSYSVPDDSVLRELIHKRIDKVIKKISGIESVSDANFYIKLNFLISDNKNISAIYVETNSKSGTKLLKRIVEKKDNITFFENLFKRLDYKEIKYNLTS